ncbi:MAG: hypothetical protein C4560_05790 [Nitrospiraceae bacterium]|nr:MAG: hypothetical protein C4560_05790 [Nitrospiraceae bacterium]
MLNNYSAGGYIAAWCTKCRLELGHTIIAMLDNSPKRVKCNTCNGEHNFRTSPSEKKQAKPEHSAKKTKSQKTNYNEYMIRLTSCNLSTAKKYSIKGNFGKDDLIDHPAFGIGIVLSVIQINKIKIFFKDGPRLLIQNSEAAAQ